MDRNLVFLKESKNRQRIEETSKSITRRKPTLIGLGSGLEECVESACAAARHKPIHRRKWIPRKI